MDFGAHLRVWQCIFGDAQLPESYPPECCSFNEQSCCIAVYKPVLCSNLAACRTVAEYGIVADYPHDWEVYC